MTQNKVVFAGLVFDEFDNPLEVGQVGNEAVYILNDQGFKKHIPAEKIDRAVLSQMGEMVKGHEDLLAEQAAKMLGAEDIFSKAVIENQIKNIDSQLEEVLKIGIPEAQRAYLGMSGLKIIVDYHGEVVKVEQPGMHNPEGDE